MTKGTIFQGHGALCVCGGNKLLRENLRIPRKDLFLGRQLSGDGIFYMEEMLCLREGKSSFCPLSIGCCLLYMIMETLTNILKAQFILF